jgi:DNA helicase II / ATP-dependent DNA helicase PcrA
MSIALAAPARARLSAAELARALGVGHEPTPEQAAVIEAPMQPLLVVAGAGSGKTETMAARVVWLVANGLVEPEDVLGLTFTRKAASELAARVERRLRTLREVGLWTPSDTRDGGAPGGPDVFAGRPTITTYHSYAGTIVTDFGLRLGVEPTVRLLTEAATWQLAYEAAVHFDGEVADFELGESALTNVTLNLAGELAEHLVDLETLEDYLAECARTVAALPTGRRSAAPPKDLKDIVASLRARSVAVHVARRYGRMKAARDAMDFSDQMAFAARLAREFPDIADIERQRYPVVLLDEFQDTSHAQLELLRSLFARSAVTAVGDPHQSIYGWRGASATTLAAFRTAFAEAAPDAGSDAVGGLDDGDAGVVRALPLATSWRNAERVLTAANAVAGPLRSRASVPVAELAARPGAPPGRVFVARHHTDRDEAAALARWLAERGAGRPGVSAAVLCRKRRQFRPVMEALEAQGVPFEVVGLGGLLLTPEVEDVVALLNVVHDPSRGDHLMRLLLGPLVRIGAADLDGLWQYARERHRRDRATDTVAPGRAREAADSVTLVDALDELPSPDWTGPRGESVSPLALQRLAELADVIRSVRSESALPLPDLVSRAERALGLDIEVTARPGYYLSAARAHLDAFVDVAAEFAARADRVGLGAFLAWLDAAEEHERGLETRTADSASGPVAIMTVHAAKGLEWDLVAVPGLVEATFPSHNSSSSSGRSGRWTIGAQTGKGWLGAVTNAGIPHALRGDRAALPDLDWRNLSDTVEARTAFARFADEMGAHAMDEERRLAYVALTRARDQLLLSCSVWGPQKTPRVTSRFVVDVLEGAGLLPEAPQDRDQVLDEGLLPLGVDGPATVLTWAPMPPVADARRPETDAAAGSRWPDFPADGSPTDARQERLAEAVTAGLRRAPWGGIAADDPVRVLTERVLAQDRRQDESSHGSPALEAISASSLVVAARSPEEFAWSLRRPMPSPPNPAARRGSRFHVFVEQHYGRAAMLDWDELPGSADPPEDVEADAELTRMKALFLASEWADRIPVAIETDVETVLTTSRGPVSVRGRIDAVFRGRDDRATVVDWKSGRPGAPDELAVRALQLAVYALAWERIHDLPSGSVDVAFYFAGTGETVWPDAPPEAVVTGVLDAVAAQDLGQRGQDLGQRGRD